jgi:hypothetical protein
MGGPFHHVVPHDTAPSGAKHRKGGDRRSPSPGVASAVGWRASPRSPTAEAGALKALECGFESRRGYPSRRPASTTQGTELVGVGGQVPLRLDDEQQA